MKGLLEVFYRPGALFASLPGRKGAWVAPVIANCLLLLLLTYLVPHYMGRENMMRRSHQTQAAIAGANSPGRVYGSYAFAVISTPLVLLILSVALFAFTMMTSRVPKFMAVFSMVSLAFFPYWLVTTAMTAAILMSAPDPTSLDIGNLLATNVGAFMDRNTMAKGLYSLTTSLDILSFAEIGLLSYGFAKLTRVSIFFGLAAVLGLWILYVSSKMALSLLLP